MSRIPLLPKWVLPSGSSIYDLESATLSEMVPKLYGAMRNLINDYNNLADELNEEIRNFTGSSSKEIANFKKSIENRLICQFQAMDTAFAKMKVDILKYSDDKIAEIYDQYLNGYVDQRISEKIAAGDINITLVYDPVTESLNVVTAVATLLRHNTQAPSP